MGQARPRHRRRGESVDLLTERTRRPAAVLFRRPFDILLNQVSVDAIAAADPAPAEVTT